MWWQRALADGLVDELELFHRAAGERLWLGWRYHGRGVLWTPVCLQEGSDGGVVGRQGRLGGFWRADENGARPCGRAKARGKTRRLGCAHVQNVRSRRAHSMHATCSTESQGGLEGLGEAGN